MGEQPTSESENNQKLPIDRSDVKDAELSEKPLPLLSDEQAIRATELGLKPMALVGGAYDTDLPCIVIELISPKPVMRSGVLVAGSIEKRKNYIYYSPGQESAAQALEKTILDQYDLLFGKLQEGDVWVPPSADKKYHKKLGELLGYKQKEIDEFLQRNKVTEE